MANLGGKSAWIAAGVVILLALAVVPTIAGAASPSARSVVAATSPTSTCSTSSHGGPPPTDTQWAYGGQGWSNWSFSFNNVTITYNSSFGWTVVFTVLSNATTGITMLEEQRTLGINVWSNVTKPNLTVSYLYHAQEIDGAFANVTNHSTVYVNDQPVAALGILNASVAACSEINQALVVANQTVTRTASLNVTGVAEASVAFSPSLGLVPLNLTGVYMWNSSATATSAASWNISYAYTKLDGASGSGSKVGSFSGTAEVYLIGYRCSAHHGFSDHKSRLGAIVTLQGPFNSYDGFILLPRGFDFFGTASHAYDPYGFGTAGISSESLYLSSGRGGLMITAADQSFGAVNSGVNGFAGPNFDLASPASPSSPAATVYGQPMTVSQAKAVDQGLTGTPVLSTHTPSRGTSGFASGASLVVVLVAVVVAVVVGTVVAVEWVSFRRSRSTNTERGSQNTPPEGASLDPNRRS